MNPKYEAFMKVAESGSFKQAALELGYTQAGVSYMMNALEQEMGCALFVRNHSGTRLTADGQTLLPWIQDVYNSERALQTKLAEVRNIEGGTMRIASFASVAIHWLPGIMKEFLDAHPHVHFEIECFEEQDELEAATWRGDFDCGFVVVPTKQAFHTVKLAYDPIYVVVNHEHPLAHETYFPIESLNTEPYIKVRNNTHTEMDSLFERNGVSPQVRFSMDNDYAVMGMVAQGLGFGVFPKLILRDIPFDLVEIKPEVPLNRQLALAVRSWEKASHVTKAFVEHTQRWVAAHL